MYIIIKRLITAESTTLLIFSAILWLCSMILLYGVYGIWENNTENRKHFQRYSSLISGNSQFENLKNEIKTKQALLEKKHTELTKGLADPHDLSSVLTMIFDKAQQSRIKLNKTIPQPEVHDKDIVRYPVLVEFTTEYKTFTTFLSSLEQIPQVLRVERIAVSAGENETVQVILLVVCYLGAQ